MTGGEREAMQAGFQPHWKAPLRGGGPVQSDPTLYSDPTMLKKKPWWSYERSVRSSE